MNPSRQTLPWPLSPQITGGELAREDYKDRKVNLFPCDVERHEGKRNYTEEGMREKKSNGRMIGQNIGQKK